MVLQSVSLVLPVACCRLLKLTQEIEFHWFNFHFIGGEKTPALAGWLQTTNARWRSAYISFEILSACMKRHKHCASVFKGNIFEYNCRSDFCPLRSKSFEGRAIFNISFSYLFASWTFNCWFTVAFGSWVFLLAKRGTLCVFLLKE